MRAPGDYRAGRSTDVRSQLRIPTRTDRLRIRVIAIALILGVVAMTVIRMQERDRVAADESVTIRDATAVVTIETIVPTKTPLPTQTPAQTAVPTPTETPTPLPTLPPYVPETVPAAAVETSPPPPPPPQQPRTSGVEQWRDLVASVFPMETVDAVLRVMACESGGNPNATGAAGEMGLMQIHPTYHSDATYDPLGNLQAAYRISSGGTNWGPWTCKPW